jgi:hypothetical protein
MIILVQCSFSVLEPNLLARHCLFIIRSCCISRVRLYSHQPISKDLEDLAEASTPYPLEDLVGGLVAFNEPWILRHCHW